MDTTQLNGGEGKPKKVKAVRVVKVGDPHYYIFVKMEESNLVGEKLEIRFEKLGIPAPEKVRGFDFSTDYYFLSNFRGIALPPNVSIEKILNDSIDVKVTYDNISYPVQTDVSFGMFTFK